MEIQSNGRPTFIEVKGGFKLGSYQRARLAFDQARLEFPWADWAWVEKKGGKWKVDA
jgi:hypothetical protein